MKNDGGPAYPLYLGVYNEPKPKHNHGMTMRQFYAAQALTGLLAADAGYGTGHPRWIASQPVQPGGGNWLEPDGVARTAFEIADAMIRAEKT